MHTPTTSLHHLIVLIYALSDLELELEKSAYKVDRDKCHMRSREECADNLMLLATEGASLQEAVNLMFKCTELSAAAIEDQLKFLGQWLLY